MLSEFSLTTKNPNSHIISERLAHYGIAVEYFSSFYQEEHDFHSHNFVEILYVIRGTFHHIAADTLYEEREGNLTILNFNQYHSLATPYGPVELMNIYLDPQRYPIPKLGSPLDLRIIELIPLHPELGNRLNRIEHVTLPDPSVMTAIVNLMYREQNLNTIGSQEALDALFTHLLIELARSVPLLTGNTSHSTSKMEKVINYVETHYTEQISLSTLCDLSGLKKSNLCTQFKEWTGMSIGTYITQRRLALALHKLRNSDDKVLTISLESGFPDISRFNRLFRATFGCTPRAYRNHSASGVL